MFGTQLETRTQHIRALFISDLHLGSRFARAGEVLRLLQTHEPEMLYLVGDILDARVLQRRWYWPPIYNAILNRLAELATSGTQIFYAPGNHDTFLRDVHLKPGPLEIQDSFMHECLDGRRLSVLHGDQFDDVESHAKWLSHTGSLAYESLIAADRGVNRALTKARIPNVRFSRFLKQSTKKIVQHISGFEQKLVDHVTELGCDGLVCGHVHLPTQRTIGDGLLYVNLGDWIENTTALVEGLDGRLELIDFDALTSSAPSAGHGRESLPLSPTAAQLASDFFAGWLGAAA